MKQTVACVSHVFVACLNFDTNLKVCSHASVFRLQNSGTLCFIITKRNCQTNNAWFVMLLTRLPIRRTIGLLQLYKDLLFSFLFIYDRERMPFSFQTRAKLCYEERISVREVFDFKTGETSENSSSANSIPPEFLLPPFLAACGHFLGQSVVCPWGTWKQPAIIYSTTVGFTGTNKSAAMDVIKEAIKESAQGLSVQNSRINQSATVESLLKQLTHDNKS